MTPDEAVSKIATFYCEPHATWMRPEACRVQQGVALKTLCDPFSLITRHCLACPKFNLTVKPQRRTWANATHRKQGDYKYAG